MDRKKLVRLWYHKHAGLIIPYPTGVWYQNQVGGHSCGQECLEGFFVPLMDPHLWDETPVPDSFASYIRTDKKGRWIDLQDALEGIILGKYGGECSQGIDVAIADKIDALLHIQPAAMQAGLSVDRTKLERCQEAWVFVTGKNIYNFEELGDFEGVLTWMNSD